MSIYVFCVLCVLAEDSGSESDECRLKFSSNSTLVLGSADMNKTFTSQRCTDVALPTSVNNSTYIETDNTDMISVSEAPSDMTELKMQNDAVAVLASKLLR